VSRYQRGSEPDPHGSGPVARGPAATAGPGPGLRWLVAAGVAVGLAACASLEWRPVGPRQTAPVVGAEPVGAEECGVCHEDVQGYPRIAGYHADCESCHGNGSLHAEADAWVHIRYPANGDCLQCHAAGRDSHLQWGTGQHSRAGLLCSDCHNPHERSPRHLRPSDPRGHVAALPDMDRTSRLCTSCHTDVAADLRLPSHHPVGEGKLACTGCHDPHEDRRLRFARAGALCGDCHQDVSGPYVFEHPPAVEDCMSCHAPHGSPTDHLLDTVQPSLCLGCHSLADQFHNDQSGGMPAFQEDRSRTFFRNCTNCPGAVHGSHTDEHLRH